jgi:hypothetical protein
MFGLTLRKGSREYFYRELDKSFTGIREKYQSRFGERYECISLNAGALMDTFKEQCDKLKINRRMSFYRPELYQQQSIF